MTLNRVRVLWQNFSGAPGYTNHYVGSLVTAQTAIRQFYQDTSTFYPTGMTISVPSSGDQINEATGQIIGSWSGTTQTNVTGTGAGNYSGPSGAIVNWRTSLVVNGRRPMGRTFLVPLVVANYDANGTLASATVTGITNAANALITALAGELKIWHRPDTKGPGVGATVISCQVPDMAAVLKSRRT